MSKSKEQAEYKALAGAIASKMEEMTLNYLKELANKAVYDVK